MFEDTVDGRLSFAAIAIRSLSLDLRFDFLGHSILFHAAVHPCRPVSVGAGDDVERLASPADRMLLVALLAAESASPAALRAGSHDCGVRVSTSQTIACRATAASMLREGSHFSVHIVHVARRANSEAGLIPAREPYCDLARRAQPALDLILCPSSGMGNYIKDCVSIQWTRRAGSVLRQV